MWTREVALSIVPLFVLNFLLAAAFVTFYIRRATGKTDVTSKLDSRHRSTAVLGSTFREFWFWLIDPIERALIAVHFTPNVITTIGLLLSMLAGVLYMFGHVGSAGWTLIASGTCDMFDGRVARATGQQTRSGAFYDSVLDRIGESFVFAGIAAYFQHSALMFVALAALVGSLLVSYIKSRAEGVGAKCDVGLMQRPERIFLLSSVSIMDPLFKAWGADHGFPDVHYLLLGGVSVIALLTWYTTIQRIVYGFREIDALEQAQMAREGKAPVVNTQGAEAETEAK